VKNTLANRQAEAPFIEAVRKIAELVAPEHVSLGELTRYMGGYNKQKAVEHVVEAAKKDPLMTKVRLHLIYTELRKLADNGGFY